MQYASDSTMKIVFTSSQPSIVVTYDTVQGIHTVWALRKVTHDVSNTLSHSCKPHFFLNVYDKHTCLIKNH